MGTEETEIQRQRELRSFPGSFPNSSQPQRPVPDMVKLQLIEVDLRGWPSLPLFSPFVPITLIAVEDGILRQGS